MSAEILPFIDRTDEDPLVDALIDPYLIHQRSRLAPEVFAARERILNRYRLVFGPRRVSGLKGLEFKRWLASVPQWQEPATRWDAYAAVKRLYTWAVHDLRIDVSPYQSVRLKRPEKPRPAGPTVRTAIDTRLEHLSLRVETASFSRDAFANIRRNLTRYRDAWSVVLADGRHFLVPAAEAGRRRPLEFAAATADDAIKQALRIAAKLLAPPDQATQPTATKRALKLPAVRCNADRLFDQLAGDDLARWLLANPQWQSGDTKHNNLGAIVDAFTWYAEEHGSKHGSKSPYKRRSVPKFVRLPRREATDDEYVALLRGRSSRVLRRALWSLYNVQGMRTCEMREMEWPDFNWEQGYVLLYKHKTARATGKGRMIVLTRRQLRFYRNLFRRRPAGTERVHLNSDSTPWDRHTFARHLRRTAKRIGLDDGVEARVSGYCLRHTYATQADEAGLAESIRQRQDATGALMGHADGSMVRGVYSHAGGKLAYLHCVAEETERLRGQLRRQRRLGDKK